MKSIKENLNLNTVTNQANRFWVEKETVREITSCLRSSKASLSVIRNHKPKPNVADFFRRDSASDERKWKRKQHSGNLFVNLQFKMFFNSMMSCVVVVMFTFVNSDFRASIHKCCLTYSRVVRICFSFLLNRKKRRQTAATDVRRNQFTKCFPLTFFGRRFAFPLSLVLLTQVAQRTFLLFVFDGRQFKCKSIATRVFFLAEVKLNLTLIELLDRLNFNGNRISCRSQSTFCISHFIR